MSNKVEGPRLAALVRRSLDRFADHGISQARIARALGIATGYLSRLKTGKPAPRRPLALLLYLLARDPKSIESVEQFWLSLPTTTQPFPTDLS